MYSESSCLILRLNELITEVSHSLSLVIKIVMLMIVTSQMMKKITAQGPCKLPIPYSSIVPIVIP